MTADYAWRHRVWWAQDDARMWVDQYPQGWYVPRTYEIDPDIWLPDRSYPMDDDVWLP